MSTEAEFVDEKECQYSIDAVRSDTSLEKFVIFGHPDNTPNSVGLVTTGVDTADIASNVDDQQILYILARYDSEFDMSNTVKFVYIKWTGDQVPFVTKAKFGIVHGSISDKLGQAHITMETGSVDELSDDYIQEKLAETAGRTSKVLDSIEGHQERGFTASQTTQQRTAKSGATVTSSFSSTKPSLEIDEEVYSSLEAVKHDMDQTTWCLARYDNRIQGPMRKVADGRGDLMELKSYLDPSLVMYGLYRVTDIVDDIQTIKFVFIMWVGPDVKPLDRAKVSTHRGVIEEAFKPVHVCVIASELSDISDRIVKEKVMAASGSKSWVM